MSKFKQSWLHRRERDDYCEVMADFVDFCRAQRLPVAVTIMNCLQAFMAQYAPAALLVEDADDPRPQVEVVYRDVVRETVREVIKEVIVYRDAEPGSFKEEPPMTMMSDPLLSPRNPRPASPGLDQILRAFTAMLGAPGLTQAVLPVPVAAALSFLVAELHHLDEPGTPSAAEAELRRQKVSLEEQLHALKETLRQPGPGLNPQVEQLQFANEQLQQRVRELEFAPQARAGDIPAVKARAVVAIAPYTPEERDDINLMLKLFDTTAQAQLPPLTELTGQTVLGFIGSALLTFASVLDRMGDSGAAPEVLINLRNQLRQLVAVFAAEVPKLEALAVTIRGPLAAVPPAPAKRRGWSPEARAARLAKLQNDPAYRAMLQANMAKAQAARMVKRQAAKAATPADSSTSPVEVTIVA